MVREISEYVFTVEDWNEVKDTTVDELEERLMDAVDNWQNPDEKKNEKMWLGYISFYAAAIASKEE